MAFLALIDARIGTSFHRISGGWAFKLDIVRGNIVVTGGTIELSDGRVVMATIEESEAGQKVESSSTYSHVNAAPAIEIPAVARGDH